MEKEALSAILKYAGGTIVGAGIAVAAKSDNKAIKGLAAVSAVAFGGVAVAAGVVELDDLLSAVTEATT